MFMGPPNLFRQETLKPQRVSVTLGRLAGYFRPYWPALLGVLAAVLLASYSQVLSPARCWYGGGSFAGLILLVAGLYLASSAMSGLQFYLMSWAGQHVLRRLRVELFQHLQRLSIGYYTRNEAGGVMSRITNDMDTLQQVLGFALVSVAGGAVLIVWIAVQMLLLSPPYALLSMAVLPLMALTTSWLSGQARKAFR